MHVLHPADQAIQRGCRPGRTAAGGRRCAARLRPVLSGGSHGIRRPERPGKQSGPPGEKWPRHAITRRTGDQAESVLPGKGEVKMVPAPELLPYKRIRDDLFRPLGGISRAYALATVAAFLVGLAGLVAWAYQLRSGMGVTGLQRPVFWGIYIVDFVFWIGISHAGTLISAILRLTGAAWRKPITRAAEAITVFALMIGGMFPIIHLGRAWLFYWLLPY